MNTQDPQNKPKSNPQGKPKIRKEVMTLGIEFLKKLDQEKKAKLLRA